MAELGYVGLGVMGSSVTRRLLDAGHTVHVWNRTREKAEPLLEAGAQWADSPREVAERADIVFTMVTNTAAVRAVFEGDDGILAGLTPGKIYVDMSTASPANSRALAEQVEAAGAQMLDSPVSGTSITVDQGKASLMVGGDADAFERAKPILEAIGPKVFHMGGNGTAVGLKIAINLSLAVQMLAFSEGVLLAEKSGIDRERVVEAMLASVIASPMVAYRGPLVLGHPDEVWFDCHMMQKDMNLALEMGRELDDGRHQRVPHRRERDGDRRQGLRRHLRRARVDERGPDGSDRMSATASRTEISAELALEMYRRMTQIRLFEEQANDLYRSAKMPGLTHLYIGEEAIAVGVCSALRKDDWITSTHRGHGHCLAKGADVARMFAELLGKEAGYCRGKGGSMHIADHENGNLGANAIVGGSAGIATGAAYSAKFRGTDQVAVCFFGEGALGQGLVYEVMNMAALWQLPVIYVCENNMYNEYTHYLEATAGDILGRPKAFGIETREVDGQDVRAVYAVTAELVERARNGNGPAFLLANTYRYHGHHVGDVDRAYYRSKDEEALWRDERDPLAIFGRWLEEQKHATPDDLVRITDESRAEIEAGVQFALDAPFPDPSQVTEDLYA
jgi:acetoin:2,6-dichlorophenolindophenol oxidoreductase subunit alpha